MHVRTASALLTLLYAVALAVAVTDLGTRALPGAVVLAGLLLRVELLRVELRRHRPAVPAVAVPAPAEEPAAP